MIVPILNGLLKFKAAPITWILFFLNGAVFLIGMVPAVNSQSTLNEYLDDNQFLRLQGRIFSQFVLSHPDDYSPLVKTLAERSQRGDSDKLKLLGTLAVRSSQFMSEGPELKYQGDQVEISRWRKKFFLLQAGQDRHPSYVLGLTADDLSLTKWMSYMFVHSGPYHFLGNMYFLLIFGSMLEPLIGGVALLVVFLLSGMVGAGVFLLFSGATAAPLIGASGSISGLMALFCLYCWRTPVRYMYFLLPSTHYVGIVFLPAWVVLVMFGISDLTGYWGAVNDFGGVAYTAHLGGEAAALVIGLVIYFLRFGKARKSKPSTDPKVPVGTPISIAEMVATGRS